MPFSANDAINYVYYSQDIAEPVVSNLDEEIGFYCTIAAQLKISGHTMGVISADGKSVCTGSDESEGSDFLRVALKRWDALPAKDRAPGAIKVKDWKPARRRYEPLEPGGLAVKAYRQFYDRKPDGEYATASWELQIWVQEPLHNTLWLKAAEVQSLVPSNPRKGDTFEIAAPILERIFLCHFWGPGMPLYYEGGALLRRQITVEEASAGEIRMRLDAAARMEVKKIPGRGDIIGEAKILGYLTYDRKQQRFTRFDLVGTAEHRAERTEDHVPAVTFSGHAMRLARPGWETEVMPYHLINLGGGSYYGRPFPFETQNTRGR